MLSIITIFFTYSFDKGVLSAVWLLSFVIPIYKKGIHADANNYCPIVLTSIMCKLVEVIIKEWIVWFFYHQISACGYKKSLHSQ